MYPGWQQWGQQVPTSVTNSAPMMHAQGVSGVNWGYQTPTAQPHGHGHAPAAAVHYAAGSAPSSQAPANSAPPLPLDSAKLAAPLPADPAPPPPDSEKPPLPPDPPPPDEKPAQPVADKVDPATNALRVQAQQWQIQQKIQQEAWEKYSQDWAIYQKQLAEWQAQQAQLSNPEAARVPHGTSTPTAPTTATEHAGARMQQNAPIATQPAGPTLNEKASSQHPPPPTPTSGGTVQQPAAVLTEQPQSQPPPENAGTDMEIDEAASGRSSGDGTPATTSPEMEALIKEETDFENQYKEWQKSYDDWRNQNKDHPNQDQFREYEKTWKTYQQQMDAMRSDIVERKSKIQEKMAKKTVTYSAAASTYSAPPQEYQQPPTQVTAPTQVTVTTQVTAPTQATAPSQVTAPSAPQHSGFNQSGQYGDANNQLAAQYVGGQHGMPNQGQVPHSQAPYGGQPLNDPRYGAPGMSQGGNFGSGPHAYAAPNQQFGGSNRFEGSGSSTRFGIPGQYTSENQPDYTQPNKPAEAWGCPETSNAGNGQYNGPPQAGLAGQSQGYGQQSEGERPGYGSSAPGFGGPRQGGPHTVGDASQVQRFPLPGQYGGLSGQMGGPAGYGQIGGPMADPNEQMSGPPGYMGGPRGQMGAPRGLMGGPHAQTGGPPGQMGRPYGQMGGPRIQMDDPRAQMGDPRAQMTGLRAQMAGPRGPYGQMDGPPGQMGGPRAAMTGPRGQMGGPYGQAGDVHGQMADPHGQTTGPHGRMPGPRGQGFGPRGPVGGPRAPVPPNYQNEEESYEDNVEDTYEEGQNNDGFSQFQSGPRGLMGPRMGGPSLPRPPCPYAPRGPAGPRPPFQAPRGIVPSLLDLPTVPPTTLPSQHCEDEVIEGEDEMEIEESPTYQSNSPAPPRGPQVGPRPTMGMGMGMRLASGSDSPGPRMGMPRGPSPRMGAPRTQSPVDPESAMNGLRGMTSEMGQRMAGPRGPVSMGMGSRMGVPRGQVPSEMGMRMESPRDQSLSEMGSWMGDAWEQDPSEVEPDVGGLRGPAPSGSPFQMRVTHCPTNLETRPRMGFPRGQSPSEMGPNVSRPRFPPSEYGLRMGGGLEHSEVGFRMGAPRGQSPMERKPILEDPSEDTSSEIGANMGGDDFPPPGYGPGIGLPRWPGPPDIRPRMGGPRGLFPPRGPPPSEMGQQMSAPRVPSPSEMGQQLGAMRGQSQPEIRPRMGIPRMGPPMGVPHVSSPSPMSSQISAPRGQSPSAAGMRMGAPHLQSLSDVEEQLDSSPEAPDQPRGMFAALAQARKSGPTASAPRPMGMGQRMKPPEVEFDSDPYYGQNRARPPMGSSDVHGNSNQFSHPNDSVYRSRFDGPPPNPPIARANMYQPPQGGPRARFDYRPPPFAAGEWDTLKQGDEHGEPGRDHYEEEEEEEAGDYADDQGVASQPKSADKPDSDEMDDLKGRYASAGVDKLREKKGKKDSDEKCDTTAEDIPETDEGSTNEIVKGEKRKDMADSDAAAQTPKVPKCDNGERETNAGTMSGTEPPASDEKEPTPVGDSDPHDSSLWHPPDLRDDSTFGDSSPPASESSRGRGGCGAMSSTTGMSMGAYAARGRGGPAHDAPPDRFDPMAQPGGMKILGEENMEMGGPARGRGRGARGGGAKLTMGEMLKQAEPEEDELDMGMGEIATRGGRGGFQPGPGFAPRGRGGQDRVQRGQFRGRARGGHSYGEYEEEYYEEEEDEDNGDNEYGLPMRGGMRGGQRGGRGRGMSSYDEEPYRGRGGFRGSRGGPPDGEEWGDRGRGRGAFSGGPPHHAEEDSYGYEHEAESYDEPSEYDHGGYPPTRGHGEPRGRGMWRGHDGGMRGRGGYHDYGHGDRDYGHDDQDYGHDDQDYGHDDQDYGHGDQDYDHDDQKEENYEMEGDDSVTTEGWRERGMPPGRGVPRGRGGSAEPPHPTDPPADAPQPDAAAALSAAALGAAALFSADDLAKIKEAAEELKKMNSSEDKQPDSGRGAALEGFHGGTIDRPPDRGLPPPDEYDHRPSHWQRPLHDPYRDPPRDLARPPDGPSRLRPRETPPFDGRDDPRDPYYRPPRDAYGRPGYGDSYPPVHDPYYRPREYSPPAAPVVDVNALPQKVIDYGHGQGDDTSSARSHRSESERYSAPRDGSRASCSPSRDSRYERRAARHSRSPPPRRDYRERDRHRLDDLHRDSPAGYDSPPSSRYDSPTPRVQGDAGNLVAGPEKVVRAEKVMVDGLLTGEGRAKRPANIVVIMRGLPGSGKTYMSQLIKTKEVAAGGTTPRMLCIDDYFMAEVEKAVPDSDTGKMATKMVLEYEYEAEMEDSYRESLLKSFKKQIDNGYFSFLIVDAVLHKVEHLEPFWSHAKSKGFQVYVAEVEAEPSVCFRRNNHGRRLADIEKLQREWEEAAPYWIQLDIRSLLQEASIEEVEMEDTVEDSESPAEATNDDEDDEEEPAFKKSRWEVDTSEDKLDRLDGTKLKQLKHPSLQDTLELTDDYSSRNQTPGQKRVRWADIEEREKQLRRRDMGFVVGQMDWAKLQDDSYAARQLNQTKFI